MATTKAPKTRAERLPTVPTDNAQLIELAKETLSAVCRSDKAPAAAKAQAARTLLELAGALKGTGQQDTAKAQSELTAAEVDSALESLLKIKA